MPNEYGGDAPGHAAAADGGGYPISDLVGALALGRDNNAGGFETACSRPQGSGGRSDMQPPFRLTRAFEETKEPFSSKAEWFSPCRPKSRAAIREPVRTAPG